jgi:hypothetical protein
MQDHRDPIDQDNRLQVDPQLSARRVGPGRIALMTIAALAVIVAVLYGINRQGTETAATGEGQTAGAPPAVAPPATSQAGREPAPTTNNISDQRATPSAGQGTQGQAGGQAGNQTGAASPPANPNSGNTGSAPAR